MDLRKMDRILSLDPALRTLTVEAGATWHDVAEYVESKGFALPVLPAAAMASTIGGAINSGVVGYGTYRNGSLREATLDLQAVLPDGRVIRTAPRADAGGAFADLTPFFFGAEGTLGIVTQATLRLAPKPDLTKPVAYGFGKLGSAAAFLRTVPETGAVPYHAALLDRDHFVMERALRKDAPKPADTVLVALAGTKDDVADQEKTLDSLAARTGGHKLDAAVAESLWDRRFTMYSARRLSKGLVVSTNEIPLGRLEEGVDAAHLLMARMKLNGSVQASLVNGSTALLAPYVLMDDTTASGGTALGFVKKLGDAAVEMGGHPMGLGLLMVFNLRRMHRRAAPYYASLKAVFDPHKKVNGGKTVELWTKFSRYPGIRAIPPPAMAAGLNLAAFFRRIKPTQDKFVRTYEREKEA